MHKIKKEQRNHIRVSISGDLKFTAIGEPHLNGIGQITNISSGGISFYTNSEIAKEKLSGRILDIFFKISDDIESIYAKGIVTWVNSSDKIEFGQFEVGVKFISIEENDRGKIHRYIHSKVKRIKFIINPVAGRGILKRTLKLLKRLMKLKNPAVEINFFLSGQQGDVKHVAREAAEKGYDIVVVAGGDGTINEAVNGLVGTSAALAVIPLGTGNVFATELGIPKNIAKACELIYEGFTRYVDIGQVEEHCFIWTAGVGVDAIVASETTSDLKDKWGSLSYLGFALRHLRDFKYPSIDVILNGQKVIQNAIQVMIGNSTTHTGNININCKDSMGDGKFDIIGVRKLSALWVMRQVLWFVMGRRAYYKDMKYLDFSYYTADKVKIDAESPTLVHVDGEIIGTTPVEFRILPKALKVIVPSSKYPEIEDEINS